MYKAIVPGTYGTDGFDAEVLRFTDDLEDAKTYSTEVWKITYVDWSWKIWKEEPVGISDIPLFPE